LKSLFLLLDTTLLLTKAGLFSLFAFQILLLVENNRLDYDRVVTNMVIFERLIYWTSDCRQ
jgi:hypothetical protein